MMSATRPGAARGCRDARSRAVPQAYGIEEHSPWAARPMSVGPERPFPSRSARDGASTLLQAVQHRLLGLTCWGLRSGSACRSRRTRCGGEASIVPEGDVRTARERNVRG